VKKIDLKKPLPPGMPAKIIASFEKKSELKLTGMHTWHSAVSIARGGEVVLEGCGDENGLSRQYTVSCQAEANGRNGKGFAATFPNGKKGAKQFCANYFKSREVMDEYMRLLGTGLDPVEAFRDNVIY